MLAVASDILGVVMAKRQITQLIDDLDGTVLDDGVTINFSVNGHTYEIDLSPESAEAFHDVLAPYIKAGRPVAGNTSRTTTQGRSGGKSGRTDLAAVRAWAKDNGHDVSDRGRVSVSVLEAYDAAH